MAKRKSNPLVNIILVVVIGVIGTCLCLAAFVLLSPSSNPSTPTLAPPATDQPPTLASSPTSDQAQELLGPTATEPQAAAPTQTQSETPAVIVTKAPTNTVVPPTRTPAPLPTNTIAPAPTQPPPPTAPPAALNFDSNGDGKVTCADFSTQAQAQAAYNAGYTKLDGNDNDGKACESLP